MISLMLLCPQVGVLASADGAPWSDERIVAAVRGDKAVAAAALAELLRHGVASRTKNSGAVHSRRLVRLEAARKSRRSRDPSCRHVAAIPSKRGTIGGAMSGLDLFSNHQQDIPFKSQAFEAAPQELALAGKPFPAGKRILSRRGGKRFLTEGGKGTRQEIKLRRLPELPNVGTGQLLPIQGSLSQYKVVPTSARFGTSRSPKRDWLRFANRRFALRIVAGWRNDG
jgi:hypothetical protein